jgi:hypothetical protein
MPMLQLIAMHAEEGAGIDPYLVGGGALVVLMVAMLGILAFGKGREHS